MVTFNDHETPAALSPALDVQDVSHWYGANKVLYRVSLQVAPGQVVGVVGPSGCGKSTLLRAILGVQPPAAGRIVANGHTITKPTRDIGIVYQNYALYEFLNARQNVAIGLKLDETSFPMRFFQPHIYWRARRRQLEQAQAFLEKVGLGGAADLFPGQMSGGMRQRVALAQALILKPKLVLLDEPFGALDESMREELQLMLLRLYQENLVAKADGRVPEYTILLVTHELNEALYVSDRVIGMSRYHTEGDQGSTIVYDKPSPVFHPDDPRDYSKLIEQREQLRQAVFDPDYIKDRNRYVTFWNDLARLANPELLHSSDSDRS